MRKWLCLTCSFIYDEAEGLPEEGIAPGTRFADLPADWVCPDCGASKDDFELIAE
jgi:rubredoxin